MKTSPYYFNRKRKRELAEVLAVLPDITPNNDGKWRLSKVNNSFQIPEESNIFDLDIIEIDRLKDTSYLILYSDHDVTVNLPSGYYIQNGDTVIDIIADEMAELAIRKELSFSGEMLISFNIFKRI